HISLQITPAQESKIHKRHPSKQEQKHKQITAESQFSRQRFSVCHQAAYNFRRNGSFHRAINTGMYFIEKTWHVSCHAPFQSLIIFRSQHTHVSRNGIPLKLVSQ